MLDRVEGHVGDVRRFEKGASIYGSNLSNCYSSTNMRDILRLLSPYICVARARALDAALS